MNLKITQCLFNELKSTAQKNVQSQSPVISTNVQNPQNILSAMECLSIDRKMNIHRNIADMPLLFFPENIPYRQMIKKVDNLISKLSPQEKISGCNTGITSSNPVYNTSPQNIYHVNHFVHSNKGYTSDLDDCIGVILYNLKNSYMFHLAPENHCEQEAVKAMQLRLSDCIDELCRDNNTCKAWLIGGKECNGSHKLHKNLLDVLNNNGIKPREVLFSEGHKDFYYDINQGIIIRHGAYSCLSDLKNDFNHVVLN